MAKYDDLQKMREARDGKQAEVEQRADPAKIKEEQERLQAGEPVGGEVVEETDDDDTDDDTDVEVASEEETVTVRAHERTKPAKVDVAPAPPGTEAVEIDGKVVHVAPELAAAYRDAEAMKTSSAKDAETDALADRVAERLRGKVSVTTVPGEKTAAERAAEAALAAAEAEAELHPMPPNDLSINDPTEYDKQLKAHIAENAQRATKKALAEKDARDAVAARDADAKAAEQREVQGREILGNQFYEQYKVLAEPATRKLVDVLLEKKWDEVKDSLRRNPPKTQAEGDALKKKCFTEVAAEATRQIVSIRQQGTTIAPSTPPPALAQSQARSGAKQPAKPKEKPREKFPQGSVSAMLSKHKEMKSGPAKTPAT